MEKKLTETIKISKDTLLKLKQLKGTDLKYKTYDDVLKDRLG